MATLLIVDDDDAFREGLAETLADLGHQVVQAASGREALEQLSGAAPGAIFLDFRLPDMDGLAVLEAMRRQRPGDLPPVVMLTAYATSENTIGAMGLGAFEHLTKPVGRAAIAALLDTLFPAMEAAIAAPAGDGAFGDEAASGQARLLGASDAMRAVQKTLGRAAASDATVLITGETGTGKEVAARVLHAASQRRNGPFVAVNCAAIPHELLESELFGHARGAYTGAVQERAGLIAQADGGTLFLDEIGDMPALMQAKLLRVLQEREVMPLGASRPLPVDVRVVAATHRDLAAMVADGALPERPDVPAQCHPAAPAGAARTQRRHRAAGRAFPGAGLRAGRPQHAAVRGRAASAGPACLAGQCPGIEERNRPCLRAGAVRPH